MLAYGEVTLAAMLFHELAHQAAWVPGNNDLSEAFATVVEVEGTRRWLSHSGRSGELEAWLDQRRRQRHVAQLLLASRARLEDLYAGGAGAGAAALRQAKAAEFTALRAALEGAGAAPAGALNNAVLAAVATYDRCVPALEAELRRHGGDLPGFYALVRGAAQDAGVAARLCPDQRPARSR